VREPGIRTIAASSPEAKARVMERNHGTRGGNRSLTGFLAADLMPAEKCFSRSRAAVEVGQYRAHNFLVVSNGPTPLLIYRVRSGVPFLLSGGSTVFPPEGSDNYSQVEPGQAYLIQIVFMPQAAGDWEIMLTVDTNAGQLSLRLLGIGFLG
jgi:hypothetical protein